MEYILLLSGVLSITVKKLSTTSYVLLGQMAAKSWSAYDLTKHMRRSSLQYFWPRAESHIYDEVKNLVAHGLATVKSEATGKRARAVYSINAKGRRALKKWVAEPGAARVNEWEQLVKIFYSDYGSKEQLIAHLSDIRSNVLSGLRESMALIDADPPLGMTFPHRTHIGVLTSELLMREVETILEWTDWVEAEIADWPDTKHSPQNERTFALARPGFVKRAQDILEKYEE